MLVPGDEEVLFIIDRLTSCDLTLAPSGCEGMLTPPSTPPSSSASLSSIPSSTLISPPTHALFGQESPELEQALSPTPEPTPSLFPSALPDLTPPPGGWIAFRTPEGRLALISPDASRVIPLTEQGEVAADFVWSPNGHWLAFVIDLGGFAGGQLAFVSIESSRLIPLTPPGTVVVLTWSQDSRSLAYLYNWTLAKMDNLSTGRLLSRIGKKPFYRFQQEAIPCSPVFCTILISTS